MKTFDVEQLDLVSVLFNAFFILLNQATLVGITLLSADGYRPIWLNLLAGAVLLAFAIWTFSVWKMREKQAPSDSQRKSMFAVSLRSQAWPFSPSSLQSAK